MKLWEAMKALEEGKTVKCLSWKSDNIIPRPNKTENKSGLIEISIDFERLIKTEWELYIEPVKTYNWMEVVRGLKEGKKFKRFGWDFDQSIYLYPSGVIDSITYREWKPKVGDFEANDWIEVKE